MSGGLIRFAVPRSSSGWCMHRNCFVLYQLKSHLNVCIKTKKGGGWVLYFSSSSSQGKGGNHKSRFTPTIIAIWKPLDKWPRYFKEHYDKKQCHPPLTNNYLVWDAGGCHIGKFLGWYVWFHSFGSREFQCSHCSIIILAT